MPDNIIPIQNNGGSQRRTITNRTIIKSPNGDLVVEQEELTNISPDGGETTTTKTTTALEIDGEIIHDIGRQIIGKCQEPGCGQFVTQRTFRNCKNPDCNKILCCHHAKFHEKENGYFCFKCYRSVRIKRFFLTFLWIILFPFTRRRANNV
jgi:hypothetical protein